MSVEKIMHLALRTIASLSIALTLVACSSDDSSSSGEAPNIDGWVGAQNLDNAQVVVNQVAESGQVAVDGNGIYVGLRESTDNLSKFIATVNIAESTLLIARGQISNVDKDNNNLATTRSCQLKSGCAVDGSNYEFAEYFPATSGFEWRTIIFNADNGSRNNINAITTMAEAFAYQYDVQNNDYINEVYTAYDIVLANSQLSNLLGITEIVGDLPANLARLQYLDANYAGIANQIRYGALLGALQQLELEYQASHNSLTDPRFMAVVASEYAEDKGQLYYRTELRELSLETLYQVAHDNLLAIAPSVANSSIKQSVEIEVAKLAEDLVQAQAKPVDTLTTAQADELSQLLTADELSGISLGLEKTKLFVESINALQTTFWEEGYKAELDAYQAMLNDIVVAHKDNLNALVDQFALIQDYYVTCSVGGRDCEAVKFADVIALGPEYDSTTKVLLLGGGLDKGGLTVSQALADLRVIANGGITESQAIDILIVGTLEINNLVLKVNHTFNDSEATDINVPSSMRIYYPDAVTEVPQAVKEIQGYETIWGDFQLYDKSTIGSVSEADLSGAFRIFYRGVRDPQNPDGSELRFNIENWVLSSLITDTVTSDDNGDVTTLIITAQASNAELFYPPTEFAEFDGFFTPNNSNPVGDTEVGLLTYKLGTEFVNYNADGVDVEVIDFLNSLGPDTRYRFYPDMYIEDKNDSNGNGITDELVLVHIIEECELNKGTETVVKCGPKSLIYEERDLQATINDLWELGVFQYTSVDGRGRYFVDFRTKEVNGCLVLDDLAPGGEALDGTLLEQQVLGLDSVRMFSEVSLQNDEGIALPKTLSDMTLIAPTKDKYRVNMALSHNYTETTTDSTSDSEVILGAGSNTNVVRISYDTSADFTNSGNYSVFQAGVELALESGQVIEDQDITAFLSQTYDPDSVNYTIIENAEGVAERCVQEVGYIYDKNDTDVNQVYHLNYRNVVYGTARPTGDPSIWTVRYIDGTEGTMNWVWPSIPFIDVDG